MAGARAAVGYGHGVTPLAFALPVALVDTALFYLWHWEHRALLPEKYRGFLLSKGVLKSVVFIALVVALGFVSETASWVYAVGHVAVGWTLHIRTCRQMGVHPLTAQPRARYVQAAADWVNALEARAGPKPAQGAASPDENTSG